MTVFSKKFAFSGGIWKKKEKKPLLPHSYFTSENPHANADNFVVILRQEDCLSG